MTEHLVLVGMSVREAEAHPRLVALAAAYDGPAASVAHLQVGDPSLHAELDRLADAGATRVVLVGMSLGRLAPANSWLRRIAAHWWRAREAPPVVEVATRLALTERPDDLAEAAAVTRPIHGEEAGLTSEAWERVPGHRHQVLICRGPRCTAQRSDRTAESFVLALMARGLGDDDVLLTQTGCAFPCNHAPVVAVQPDDVWYGGLTPELVDRVVDEHLLGGAPVADLRLPR